MSPYSHVSTRLYKTVMYSSADSLSNWSHLLNQARSKIAFRWTLSNFLTTFDYLFLSSSLILVEVSTSSASGPRQYRSVLTFLSLLSLSNLEALRNNSNRRFHLSHWSGLLKSNCSGVATGHRHSQCKGVEDSSNASQPYPQRSL